MESVSFDLLENPSMTNNKMIWSGQDDIGERKSMRDDKSLDKSIEVLNYTALVPSQIRVSGEKKEQCRDNDIEDNCIEGASSKLAENSLFDDKRESPHPCGLSIDKLEFSWGKDEQVSGSFGETELGGVIGSSLDSRLQAMLEEKHAIENLSWPDEEQQVSRGFGRIEDDGKSLGSRLQAMLEEKRTSGPSNGTWRVADAGRTLPPPLQRPQILCVWSTFIGCCTMLAILSFLMWTGWNFDPNWLHLQSCWGTLASAWPIFLEKEGGWLVSSNLALDEVAGNVSISFQSTIAYVIDITSKMTTPIISTVTDFALPCSTILLLVALAFFTACLHCHLLPNTAEGENTKLKKRRVPPKTVNNRTGSNSARSSIQQSNTPLILTSNIPLILTVIAFSLLFLPALVLLNDQARQVNYWRKIHFS